MGVLMMIYQRAIWLQGMRRLFFGILEPGLLYNNTSASS